MAAVMVILAACSATDATAPSPAAPEGSASVIGAVSGVLGGVEKTVEGTAKGTLQMVTAVAWNIHLTTDQTVRARIGREGGTITVASTGLTLIIPPGAVQKPTNFSVTAIAGKGVAYEFEPHGTTFAKPLIFRQQVSLIALPWGKSPIGGYFESRDFLNPLTGQATIQESIPARVKNGVVEFLIEHFSGYLVSSA